MQPPKISIITVTYQSEGTLGTAIESVLGQTYANIEYIIVDGASKDNTADLVKSYGNGIAQFVSEPDHGIYNAMNKGLGMATGDVIGFLHADDILASPHTIEEIAQTFEKSEIGAVYGDLEYIDKSNTQKVIRYWKSQAFELPLLRKGWMPPHPTLYIKKEWIDKTGQFNEKYRIAADYDYILRLFKSPSLIVAYIPHTIVKMRVGGASNQSLRNIYLKSKEDYLALRRNKIGGWVTLLFKNLSKIEQFVKRK